MKAADLFSVEGYGAIVTGGASGIGLGMVEALAENGARVTMMDLNSQRLEEQTARLTAAGFDVRGLRVDVSDREAVRKAFAQTAEHYGRLDCVFANAGIDPGPGFVSMTDRSQRPTEYALENYADERWDRVIQVNLNSVFYCIGEAARHMKPRNAGRIVVTTSTASVRVSPGIGAAYMAAKSGAAHLVRNAALELARYNVLVNSIAPGPFVTNIGDGFVHQPGVQEAFSSRIPLKRMASINEIKGLTLLLASGASSFITGEQIVIDGGYTQGLAD
ncbi:SDR family oxidoreductase [Pseudomonas sp. UL073]|uniref:SDR family oxidoreductase n=1 Tax=Zestomonas insulae TaxID=2809017 RepID=A0ABS2ID68_9GAMM|nr:SDR family oxidoreductase [Pseudomonas insulae]MBM7061046.1 SDR family oxidoreductase [Pseudomonas insulae]